ncbi:MAG: ABC transporter ATP-binding protein [Planctomycetes bacterium]|nr:ABC transporter ATP-binding protein [Planctomycetota bacterium]
MAGADGEILIETQDLERAYRTVQRVVFALRGVSIKVRAGELLCVVGPSGSGKTTLLNLIGTLDMPGNGRVLLCGRDTGDLSAGEIAHLRCMGIGQVFQDLNLLDDLSARRNVELPMLIAGATSAQAGERAEKLLKEAGLDRTGDRPAAELSCGQRQRVAIARALANEPRIILADEPTGNLDQSAGRQIVNLLAELAARRNCAVVAATHDPQMVDAAGTTAFLRNGLIERTCRRDELSITVGAVK